MWGLWDVDQLPLQQVANESANSTILHSPVAAMDQRESLLLNLELLQFSRKQKLSLPITRSWGGVYIPGFGQLLRSLEEALHLITSLQQIHVAEAAKSVKRTAIAKGKKSTKVNAPQKSSHPLV